jgi:Na+:H+ antiporter, NhaA family
MEAIHFSECGFETYHSFIRMIKKWDLFKEFFRSEKAAGFILIGCTIISLVVSNTGFGDNYVHFWHSYLDLSFAGLQLNYSLEHWVNDGLMAIFFLLVGLEIERELYVGELSSFKNAIVPILAAIGGMLFPSLIHYAFNAGTATQAGFGIPMATDIAFALGVLSLAGNKVPVTLKIFLTALAIIDDLGAITVIAIFYTKEFSLFYFLSALAVFIILFLLGKKKIYYLGVYIIGGIIMWYLMLKSGVHATISGVLLAFAVPFHKNDNENPSYRLQHRLHYPVAFTILPLFALVNTAIPFPTDIPGSFSQENSLGIMIGLIAGKFIGISLTTFLAVKTGIASLSEGLTWRYIIGVSFLAGIGFTMSIFITNLAFNDPDIIAASKISILLASFCAAITGLLVLRRNNNLISERSNLQNND